MKNKAFFVLALLVILVLLSLVVMSTQNKTLTYQPNVIVAGTNLNSSDDSTFGVNPDDTMGPANWQGNYSNSLPDSVKGNLAFYVTDPPGNPPGLEKKNPTATPKISPTPLRPTGFAGQAETVTKGAPVAPGFLPGKDAQLTALLLTVTKVEVHRAGSGKESRWETLDIGTTPKTVDLIDLANNKLDLLFGTTKLQDGHYTEVRLYVSSALAKYSDGGQANLQILGKKNIVKIVRQFTIVAGQTTKLTVDFNAPRSVVRTGNKFLLKPVVARFIVE